jgi:hypothetical protein
MPRERILQIYRANVSKRNTVGELSAANVIQKSIVMYSPPLASEKEEDEGEEEEESQKNLKMEEEELDVLD